MQWSEYQKKAAEFFSSLGLTTSIELKVEGARGVHAVDVYVSGSYEGIPFNWVVECKAWKINVPKEKVMSLFSIVQDLGADRGFLLSEVGFQSGALLASRNSNITLTSLADLSEATARFSVDALIGKRNWEIQKAKSRLLKLKRESEAHEYNIERVSLFGNLVTLECMFEEALHNEYPIEYPVRGLSFSTLEELNSYASQVIEQANEWELRDGV